jgi:hypothetical protein
MHKRLFQKPNNKNALCWAFYYVNDNKEIDFIVVQVMRCFLCYNSPILNLNPKIQARKGLIIYNKINGITTLRKHVNSNHSNIFFKIEEEMNNPLREDEKQPLKKRQNESSNSIFNFCCKGTFQEK